MPMAPYVLVLARNGHEGRKYVKRAGLSMGRSRVVGGASSIRGLRRAEVHILPGFETRPDRHSIMAVLRYADATIKNVEMPERAQPKVKDQGDGMGQQMTIDEALAGRRERFAADVASVVLANEAESLIQPPHLEAFDRALEEERAELESLEALYPETLYPETERTRDVAIRYNRLRDLAAEGDYEPGAETLAEVSEGTQERYGLADVEPEAPIVKKGRRRSMCPSCETLHFKDEPCPVAEVKAAKSLDFD